MKVLKFGGSSVANTENIKRVLEIITKTAESHKILVVVSAFGKTTNELIKAAKFAKEQSKSYQVILKSLETHHNNVIRELIPTEKQSAVLLHTKQLFSQLETIYTGCYLLHELSSKTLATISSFGELLSSFIIAEASKLYINTNYKDSRELIIASDNYLNAAVNFEETNSKIKDYFIGVTTQVTLTPGYVARTKNGLNTTLGRGGSDYSAAIYAAALHAEELQIWTDVSGMYTANPSIVKQAFTIPRISYHEAMELSHFGAKVIYPPTIQPVLQKEIPIVIKNTFKPLDQGTHITKETDSNNQPVKGISYIEDITLITLGGTGMVGIPGFSKRLFEVLSLHEINITLITQASSELSICIGVEDTDAQKAQKLIDTIFEYEIHQQKVRPVVLEKNLCIIALVGDNMKNHQGLSGRMFSALGKNNINIRAIAQGASEKNISAVINKNDAKKALNTLHEQFFEEKIKQLNLFVTGVGNVGERFLTQIHQQKEYLKKYLKLSIKVVGISNSRKMLFDENGIDLENWKTPLKEGKATSLEGFFKEVKNRNLRNSVFVDNTANQEVSEFYEYYLSESIGIVTCNKIACASSLNNYKKLKQISRTHNVPFLFETNVGAGLPIIDTLKNLVASGDRIHKIEAVLSGSLNYVFNNFNDKTTFHKVVTAAQKEGYTEPDPKIDLSGIDVARKILILARESGYDLELENIQNNTFLPVKSLNTINNNDFYASLTQNEEHFQNIFKDAKVKNCRLKYVATFEKGDANVGLQQIPSNHPFYNLEGSDNIVLFFTDRYPTNPLIIKGAGAGADVTASGIFADIIRIGNL